MEITYIHYYDFVYIHYTPRAYTYRKYELYERITSICTIKYVQTHTPLLTIGLVLMVVSRSV